MIVDANHFRRLIVGPAKYEGRHMQDSTIPTDDRFPAPPEGIDALLQDVVDSLVNLWDCETRILNLQSEFLQIAIRQSRDRNSLDLSA